MCLIRRGQLQARAVVAGHNSRLYAGQAAQVNNH